MVDADMVAPRVALNLGQAQATKYNLLCSKSIRINTVINEEVEF